MELTLDVNTEIYPLSISDKFTFLLTASISETASNEPWRNLDSTLANDYDYVMYGKVYKYDDAAGSRV